MTNRAQQEVSQLLLDIRRRKAEYVRQMAHYRNLVEQYDVRESAVLELIDIVDRLTEQQVRKYTLLSEVRQ